MSQPEDVFGCWPVGRWSFSAQVEDNGCSTDPMLESQYAFDVFRDEEMNETYEYVNDPTNERALIKVTSGGGGLCEGSLQIYSADGKAVLNFKPALQADKTLDGQGDYDLYKISVWE